MIGKKKTYRVVLVVTTLSAKIILHSKYTTKKHTGRGGVQDRRDERTRKGACSVSAESGVANPIETKSRKLTREDERERERGWVMGGKRREGGTDNGRRYMNGI